MSRWLYYTRLAVLDLWRLWPTVWPQVVVVTGICLPIVLLQGLKKGHVAELRQDLLKSPTGREVEFWPAQRGELLTRSSLLRLKDEIPGVELVIPYAKHLGTIACVGKDGAPREVPEATFFATCPGDPVLKLLNVDVLAAGERGVILGEALAEELTARQGDTVHLTVRRNIGEKGASVPLTVKAVISGTGASQRIGYLDIQIHDWIEQYLSGYRVAELNWPAADESAPETFSSYLLFCAEGKDLQEDDRNVLDRRYVISAEKVTDEDLRILYGALKPHHLVVYMLRTRHSESDPQKRLRLKPSEVTKITSVDAVVMPWNLPQTHMIGDTTYRLVGCSLPRRSWLRSFFFEPKWAFEYGADELSIKFPFPPAPTSNEKECILRIAGKESKAEVSLKVLSRPAPHAGQTSGGLVSALVPVEFLAHLDAFQHRTVQYDSVRERFVPLPDELYYIRGRLYANTIDDVPEVVRRLTELQFAYQSQSARISEIHKQDDSLQFIVMIVGGGVFAFGIITVCSVLLESTARKRGTIGILRVMGVSRAGIFYLVFVRAAVLGLLAAALTVSIARLLEWFLDYTTVSIALQSMDLIVVFPIALTCCVAGALYP